MPERRYLLLLTIVLAIPVLPFLFWGQAGEAWFTKLLAESQHRWWTALLVVGVLASDILLPVPSSFVCTLAGSVWGILAGTALCWLGMSLGAMGGFLLARFGGRWLLSRLASAEEMQRMKHAADRYGPWLLVVTRGLPIVAEASVIWAGAQRMSLLRFSLPVLLSNLGVAMAFVVFGRLAKDHLWFPVTVGISIGVPVLLSMWFVTQLTRGDSHGTKPQR